MSTYKQIFYHIIFSTKHREPTLTEKYQDELYKYISGLVNKKHCHLYRINGMKDHLHIFSDLHPAVCLADYIKIKDINTKPLSSCILDLSTSDCYHVTVLASQGLDRATIILSR